MTALALLLPSDPLRPRRPDDHFSPEADAARELGIAVHLLDHDALMAGDIDGAVAGLGTLGRECVYRGWMIPPDRYRTLDTRLTDRGIHLRTSAADYDRAHRLPNWYEAIERWTPSSVWTHSPDLDELERAADELGSGPVVLRDHTKSEKHYWTEAMFVADVADRTTLRPVAGRLVELRGDAFDTGFVVRRFERFEAAEWRSWWVSGRCRLITAHPDTPDVAPPSDLDLAELAPDISALGLPFVTVDVTRSADDGRLRVIEIGDGQVSDRPSTTDPTAFLSSILWT